ncbi:MAG TPA: redox-sensing transcriptional repressor Rex [Candidatus Limnocylindrales bacterium]|nr:redox-sensing transcriptional repressor Rex [Candidatus Limnocylindrales bacterium]
MPGRNISKSVIKRLPIYLRVLDHLMHREVEMVSSKDISNETGFTAEQIRKDLAYFGAFGTRGAGYNTSFLRGKIIKIIGLDQKTNVIVMGAGNLGTALTRYNSTKNPYVNVVAVFDKNMRLVGRKINQIEVQPVKDAPKVIEESGILVAIITVTASEAQNAADLVVKHGVKAILNFAPVKLSVPEGVHVHNADLTIELQSLIYYITAEEERLLRLQQETMESKTGKTLSME